MFWSTVKKSLNEVPELPYTPGPFTLIPVKAIFFEWAETGGNFPMVFSHDEGCPWKLARNMLRQFQVLSPEPGHGYNKVKFFVEWADGQRYEGRYDLDQSLSCDLSEQIRGFLDFQLGLQKPDHYTEEEYEMWVNHYVGDAGKKRIYDFLHNRDVYLYPQRRSA